MNKPEKKRLTESETRFGWQGGYNQACNDWKAWLKKIIPKEKKVPECLNDASVGEYELGFNDAIIEIKKKIKGE